MSSTPSIPPPSAALETFGLLGDELVLSVLEFVGARDLLSLALSSERFSGSGSSGSAGTELSLAEAAAKRRVQAHALRRCVPRRGGESYLGLAHELEQLWAPHLLSPLSVCTMHRLCKRG